MKIKITELFGIEIHKLKIYQSHYINDYTIFLDASEFFNTWFDITHPLPLIIWNSLLGPQT